MTELTTGYALVIGIANYPFVRPLPPIIIKDAHDVTDMLRRKDRFSFAPQNVKTLINEGASRKGILDGMNWLASVTDDKSTVILYYSGHGGHFDDGPNAGTYIIPFDARLSDIKSTAISSDEFTEAMNSIHAENLIVLLESEHSGGMYHFCTVGSRGYRVTLAACQKTQVAYLLPGAQNSLFTQCVLEALDGNAARADGTVGIYDLAEYVCNEVPQRQPRQNPVFMGQVGHNATLARVAPRDRPKVYRPTPTQPGPVEINVDLLELRQFISTRMSLEEIEVLCDTVQRLMEKEGAKIDLSLDTVGGTAKSQIVTRLIKYLNNREKLHFLVQAVRGEFPGQI